MTVPSSQGPSSQGPSSEGLRRAARTAFSAEELGAIVALSRRMGFPVRTRRGRDGTMLCLTSRDIGQPVYAIAKDADGRFRVHAADGRVLVASDRFADVTTFFGIDPRIDADDPDFCISEFSADPRFGAPRRAVECRGEHSARTRP